MTNDELRAFADRLDVLAHAVTEANWSEFSMRVPVEPERDADCVLSSAAIELRSYAALLERQAQWPSVKRLPDKYWVKGAIFKDTVLDVDVACEAYANCGEHYVLPDIDRMRAALQAVVHVHAVDEPTDEMVNAALALQGEDALLAKAPALTSAIVKIYKAMRAVAPVQASSVPDVKEMVNRFLSWRLPADFYPDGGISFVHVTDPAWTHNNWPTGTNLFHAGQAEQMVRYMLDAPQSKVQP